MCLWTTVWPLKYLLFRDIPSLRIMGKVDALVLTCCVFSLQPLCHWELGQVNSDYRFAFLIVRFAITKNHWVMVLDGLTFLINSFVPGKGWWLDVRVHILSPHFIRCLVDSTASSSRFMPQSQEDKVPFQLEAFMFQEGDRVNYFAFLPSALVFFIFLPMVSLADLHDVYSEGHSCFCTRWRSLQIMFFCEWVCSCRLRACWRWRIFFSIFADGLLLMETTRLVVAVTQHVVLMVELLLPLVISRSFKIAFDLSSAVLILFLL